MDPVTGKCRPGKVARTVSTSPLRLDMTVVCTPDPDLLQPGAVAQELPFTDGNPAYGLQLHHPRFLELVGAPESARLLDCAPSFWVEELGKEGAMVAAATLQRDAGVMLSNLQMLSQFAMALNRMSFSMMALGLERSLFPGAEVDALAQAPRAHWAAPYMSAMGLWHPQRNPTVPRPVTASSCNSCMNCKYCFPEDQLHPE